LRFDRTLPQRILDRVWNIDHTPLNDFGNAPPAPDNISSTLRITMNDLKNEGISVDRVDYTKLEHSNMYQEYRNLAAQLATFDPATLQTDAEKIAFWINIYNVMVVDAIIHYDIDQSVQEVSGFFERVIYNVGGYRFSLDDIEHGILRANAGHPFIPGEHFTSTDPRRQFIVSKLDNRIHFALVCGAESCPPVNFYDADKLDFQLDLAAANFLNSSEVEISPGRVALSKILQWYSGDFGCGVAVRFGLGDKTPLLKWIAPYIQDEAKRDQLFQGRVVFKQYNWGLNV
jgi:hypothetical protein